MGSAYNVQIQGFSNWETLKKQRNVIMVGNVLDNSDLSNHILSRLPEERRPAAQEGVGFVFVEKDTFALPQKIVYVYSNSDSLLHTQLLQKGKNIADEIRLFEQQERAKKEYKDGFSTTLSEDVFTKTGFYLKFLTQTTLKSSTNQSIDLTHPQYSANIIWADTTQTLPNFTPIKETFSRVYEYKTMNTLALYNEEGTAQYAFIDGFNKRKYVVTLQNKQKDFILLDMLLYTFETATEHQAIKKRE